MIIGDKAEFAVEYGVPVAMEQKWALRNKSGFFEALIGYINCRVIKMEFLFDKGKFIL